MMRLQVSRDDEAGRTHWLPQRDCCKLCGDRQACIVGTRGRKGAPLTTVLCFRCGLIRTCPLPDCREHARYYRGLYRLEYRGAATPSLRHVYRNARAAYERLPWLMRALPSPGFVLDVGCGSGEFVRLLTRLGYRAAGLEPDPSYAGFARESFGVPVLNGFLEETPLEEGGFSCVTSFHVIEHVPDPPAFLLALRPLVRAGGRLVLETPDAESPFPRGARRFHGAHLHYFSQETLRQCAAAGGWRVLEHGRSADGGNLFLVAELDEPSPAQFAEPLGPDALRRHRAAMRAAAYFGSPHFLPRLARQIAFRVREWVAAVASEEPEQVLLRAARMDSRRPASAQARV